MDQVRESYSTCEVFGSDSGTPLLTIFRPKVADEQLILHEAAGTYRAAITTENEGPLIKDVRNAGVIVGGAEFVR